MSEGGVLDDLGATRVVNAAGHLNRLGGSTVSAEVLKAVAQVAGSYVDMRELRLMVGRRLAELTHNEAADVSCGAAAGILAGLLACADEASANDATTDGLARHPARVVVHRVHRVPPDRGMELLPIELTEIGTTFGTSVEELRRSLRGAAVLLYAVNVGPAGAAVDLPAAIRIAHEHGVPVVLDCAAELPPRDNLWRFTGELGADLAVFSGGKDLGAPQDTGLVLGRRELVDRCRELNAPNDGRLRAMKVGREQLVATLAAVRQYMAADPAARDRRAHAIHERWAQAWGTLPGVRVWARGPYGDDPYWVHVALDATVCGDAADIEHRMWNGEPRVAAQRSANVLRLTAYTVDDADLGVVEQRLQQVIAASTTANGSHDQG